MNKYIFIAVILILENLLVVFASASSVEARVTVRQLVKHCGDDQKKYCAKVKYGKTMTACITKHKVSLKPQCKILVERIEAGERVSLF